MKATKTSQAYTVGTHGCVYIYGQTDLALTLTYYGLRKKVMAATLSYFL